MARRSCPSLIEGDAQLLNHMPKSSKWDNFNTSKINNDIEHSKLTHISVKNDRHVIHSLLCNEKLIQNKVLV